MLRIIFRLETINAFDIDPQLGKKNSKQPKQTIEQFKTSLYFVTAQVSK